MDSDHLAPWLFAVGLTVLVLAELFFLVKVSTPPFEFLVPARGLVLNLSLGCDRLRQIQKSLDLQD